MKITSRQLRKMIVEEVEKELISHSLNEGFLDSIKGFFKKDNPFFAEFVFSEKELNKDTFELSNNGSIIDGIIVRNWLSRHVENKNEQEQIKKLESDEFKEFYNGLLESAQNSYKRILEDFQKKISHIEDYLDQKKYSSDEEYVRLIDDFIRSINEIKVVNHPFGGSVGLELLKSCIMRSLDFSFDLPIDGRRESFIKANSQENMSEKFKNALKQSASSVIRGNNKLKILGTDSIDSKIDKYLSSDFISDVIVSKFIPGKTKAAAISRQEKEAASSETKSQRKESYTDRDGKILLERWQRLAGLVK